MSREGDYCKCSKRRPVVCHMKVTTTCSSSHQSGVVQRIKRNGPRGTPHEVGSDTKKQLAITTLWLCMIKSRSGLC